MLILRTFWLLVWIHVCGSEEMCGKNCAMDKDTLTCTNIPSCIPDGITRVEVNKTSSALDNVVITTSNFTGRNWEKVTYLRLVDFTYINNKDWTLSEYCFTALKSVKELHLYIKRLYVDPKALVGLANLETIDFTGCYNLGINELISLLNGTNKLVGLKRIKLSDWNKWGVPGYDFDDHLIDVLLPRNITDIDLSNSQINILNATAILKRMKHLTSLNMSYTSISKIYLTHYDDLLPNETAQLEMLDITGMELPNGVNFPKMRYVFNNLTFPLEFKHDTLYLMHIINATGIIKAPMAVWANNIQLVAIKQYHFPVKELELKENNLNRLDIRIPSSNTTFEFRYLGLSGNDMEYLHSSLLSCSPNLLHLDLSRNRMYKMYDEDPQEFDQLLSGVPAITYINLSRNNLTHIPSAFLKSSQELSTLDISYNRLKHFTLNVSGLNKLRSINIRNNNIKTLDATSIHNLNSFMPSAVGDVWTREVIFTANPISCSVCSANPFLQWLRSTQLVDIKAQGLTCFDEKDNPVAIDETAISAVQNICIRGTIIISVTVSVTIVIIVVLAVFVWLYKRRVLGRILVHRNRVIDRIRMAEGPYEFAIFLSYSSTDDAFAMDEILPNLNENLKQLTGICDERNLVCTGDAYLRPGFYVHDEVDMCLDKSSVVLILVTENYCRSNYCGSELEKAYMKKKPVILMFKEHVNIDLMSRTMKGIYERNVRILWAEQNGEYVLQTTWENVCTSILDLIE